MIYEKYGSNVYKVTGEVSTINQDIYFYTDSHEFFRFYHKDNYLYNYTNNEKVVNDITDIEIEIGSSAIFRYKNQDGHDCGCHLGGNVIAIIIS